MMYTLIPQHMLMKKHTLIHFNNYTNENEIFQRKGRLALNVTDNNYE